MAYFCSATLVQFYNAIDTITVTVPADATSGPVIVTNTNGSATSPKPFTLRTNPAITGIAPSTVSQGVTTVAIVSGINLSNATSVDFSTSGLSANIRSGANASNLPINIIAEASILPGTYTFTVSTSNGIASGGSITVSSSLITQSTTKDVSVFLPGPTSVSVTGDSFSVAPAISVEILP